jgi:hypothetical protein
MELRRRQQNGLYAVAVELTNRAKLLATRHTDNGTRRNSITQTKSADGRTVLWGIPLKSAPHAANLEFGFRPHWVPGKYIGLWMQRHGVGERQTRTATLQGVTRRRKYTSSRQYKGVRSTALGLFVGGPGSTLQTAPGGTSAMFFMGGGRPRQHVRYYTSGGISEYLTRHKVGHPILQPVGKEAHTVPLEIYKRGFQRG